MRAVVFADLVNRKDVRMIESGRGLGLLLKPVQEILVFTEFLIQEFDRNLSSEPGVVSHIHITHAPGPDLRELFIVSE